MATRRKKFNIEEAVQATVGAVAGGAASAFVSEKVAEISPDAGKFAPYVPLALGAYLSQNKNKMLQSAGLGMIGASGGVLLESFGINGLSQPGQKMYLSPGQQKKMLKNIVQKQPMKAAGAVSGQDVENTLAGVIA